MELLLTRNWKKAEYTIGRFYINDKFFCNSLEDKVREMGKDGNGKIKGITAIPAGRYRVTVTWSPKYKRMMPLLNDVPHFDGIRIHSGNTAKDTDGCILLGNNTKTGMVLQSRETCNAFYKILDAALAKGEECWITIKD